MTVKVPQVLNSTNMSKEGTSEFRREFHERTRYGYIADKIKSDGIGFTIEPNQNIESMLTRVLMD